MAPSHQPPNVRNGGRDTVIAGSTCGAAIQGLRVQSWPPWIAAPKPARNDGGKMR